MKRKSAPVLLMLSLILLLVPHLSRVAQAQTLYQRSAAQLETRARAADPDDYTFVVMGDSRDKADKFKKVLALARSFDPLFILHLGDYSDRGGEAETGGFLSLLQRNVPDLPLFVVIGNHEDPAVFEKWIGPRNFTLANKRLGYSLIALDNADEVLRAPEQQLLKRELAAASGAVFVAMHIPPETGRWRGHTFTKGAEELRKILENRATPVQGLFFAHSHLYDRSEFGGVPAFITGGAGAPLVWYSGYGERVHHILVVRVIKGKSSYQMVPLK